MGVPGNVLFATEQQFVTGENTTPIHSDLDSVQIIITNYLPRYAVTFDPLTAFPLHC